MELIGSPGHLQPLRAYGYTRCSLLDGSNGVIDIRVFSPDSQWGSSNPNPERIIADAKRAGVSTLVNSGGSGDDVWAEFLASDGSRPMLDMISKNGAIVWVAITPVKGKPGTMDQVRAIAQKIAAEADLPLTLAYAAAG